MTLHRHLRFLVATGRRVTAVASVGLVLVLGLLSVCPEAHAWLHPHAESATVVSESKSRACATHTHEDVSHPIESDAGCVVDLFAQGLEPGVSAFALAVEFVVSATDELRAPDFLRLTPPRYLRQPERGPPSRV